jgi:hypothetical protein
VYNVNIFKDKIANNTMNKIREASTENEEKQKGLNIAERTTWYDRSLASIILYSVTGLSYPSYY